MILGFVGSVAAPCPVVFSPPNSFVHLTDESQSLVAFNDDSDTQRYVVRQAYEGVASDFGLVLPTPDRPNITKRSEDLFKELHDLTKEPNRNVGLMSGSAAQSLSDDGVRVVKRKDVGDFSATVLEANSSDALVDWLNRNNFDYGNQSTENFNYYIEKDENFYFTALKINVKEADCLSREEFRFATPRRFQDEVVPEDNYSVGRCWLKGGLSPIEFKYTADRPSLPLRIMSRPHDQSPMTPNAGHEDHNQSHEDEKLPPGNFLVYTLSDQPLTVPGAKVEYSDKVSNPPEELKKFTDAGNFLVRQRIKFNAHKVEEDLYFQEAKPFYVPREDTEIVNPEEIDSENGMMEFSGSSRQVELTGSDPTLVQDASFTLEKRLDRAVSPAIKIGQLWEVVVRILF